MHKYAYNVMHIYITFIHIRLTGHLLCRRAYHFLKNINLKHVQFCMHYDCVSVKQIPQNVNIAEEVAM